MSAEQNTNNMDKMSMLSQQQKETLMLGANIEIRPPRIDFEDINIEMKNYGYECADICFRLLYKQEKRYFKDIAEFVKKSFDEKFGGSWHVICGKNFGSYITYESKHIIQFWINHICFLIFKFG